MKKVLNSTISIVLAIMCLFSLAACESADTAQQSSLWESAAYLKDTEFGEGAKTVVVEVTAEDKTVTFTIKTDADTVGEALFEHDLIAGEDAEYGLYIKAVNGITADYDVDASYWAFYIDGEYAMSGVDMTEIDENVTYQLAYTK